MTDNVKVVPAKPSTNALYTQAEAALRTKHQAEFDEILDDLYAANGMTRKRRLSADERLARKHEEQRAKAAATMAELKSKFPDLFEDNPDISDTSDTADILSA